MGRKRYNAGQWRVTRERFALTDRAPPPPFREAVRLEAVLGTVMKRLGGGRHDWLDRLARDWPAVVGEDVAAHTRPGRLDSLCLFVFVDSAVWLHELKRLGQARMLQNVQAHAGAGSVKRLMLVPDPDRGG